MFQNTIVMLRRSIRKRVNPVGRGDFVAPAARRVIAPRTNITALQDTATNQISTISPGISTQVIGLPTVSDVSSMASINTDTIAVSSTSPTSSQSITGNEFVVADNPVICSKASDDLSRNVSLNIKQKIIMGEYTDLALLLVNSQTAAAKSQKLVFMKGDLLVQQKQHKKIINIENWTDAILIYLQAFTVQLNRQLILTC